MKVSVLLAEKGLAMPAGGVNLLNVGWSMAPLRALMAAPSAVPAPLMTAPQSVVVFMEAQLADCNRQLTLELTLLNQDGQVVELPGPAGPQPMRLRMPVLIPTAPGAPTGFPGRGTALLDLAQGLPLTPGVYRWQVSINDRTDEDWSISFFVPSPPQAPVFFAPPTLPQNPPPEVSS